MSFSMSCHRSLGTTSRSPLRTSPPASCISSRTFQYSCSSLGSDDIFFGHPLQMVCRNCYIMSSLAVECLNASIFSILTVKLRTRLWTMNSVSSAAQHVGSHAMYARDRVPDTYMYFSGTYFTSRSYLWSWRIIRCNLGEALAIRFFRIHSRGR